MDSISPRFSARGLVVKLKREKKEAFEEGALLKSKWGLIQTESLFYILQSFKTYKVHEITRNKVYQYRELNEMLNMVDL